jgi:hypothetical protein
VDNNARLRVEAFERGDRGLVVAVGPQDMYSMPKELSGYGLVGSYEPSL